MTRSFSAHAAVSLSGNLSAIVKSSLAAGARRGKIKSEASQLVIDRVTFGRVDAEANVTGVGADTQGAGTIRLTNGKIDGLDVCGLTLTVERKEGPLSFEMAAKSGNVSLNADGTASSRDRAVDVTLQHGGIVAPEASGKLSEAAPMVLQDRSVRFDRLQINRWVWPAHTIRPDREHPQRRCQVLEPARGPRQHRPSRRSAPGARFAVG